MASFLATFLNDFFSAAETLSFLINVYGIRFSLRQLRRVLKNRGRGGKGQHGDINGIVQAVEEELEGSGSIIGYKSIIDNLPSADCYQKDRTLGI